MDLEKLAKFFETYVREYVFSLLEVLTSLGSKTRFRSSTQASSDARRGRSWLFALLSISLGGFAFSAGQSASFMPPPLASIGLVLTIWLWLLAAAMAHLVAKVFGGKASFVGTLSACLRVFPTTYAISGLVAMSVGLFSRAITTDYAILCSLSFLVSQFLLLSIYLPTDLGRTHSLGAFGRIAIGGLVPTSILLVNVAGMFFVFSASHLLTAPSLSNGFRLSGLPLSFRPPMVGIFPSGPRAPLNPPPTHMSEPKEATSLTGYDYAEKDAATAALCFDMCNRDVRCKATTYVTAAKICWLKDAVPPAATGAADMVSSTKVTP